MCWGSPPSSAHFYHCQPELIQSNAYLAFLYDALGFGSDAQFIIFIALAMFALVLVSNVFRASPIGPTCSPI